MASFSIGSRMVGDGYPCFIIAEIGVNHNGDMKIAKKMIDAAADAGVDAAKFQLINADCLYVKDAGVVKTDSGDTIDAYKVWKNVEMPQVWLSELKKHCEKRDVLFFSSVFHIAGVDILNPYVDVYKIASAETSDIPLLKKVARAGKPVIISLGGATLKETVEAVDAVKAEGNDRIALLYCVQKYPMPFASANISALKTLRKRFPDVVVGYSDHSLMPDPAVVPAAAVVYGAKIIEKHFTLSRSMEGIDHKMSVEPKELSRMVQTIRAAEKHGYEIPKEIIGNSRIELTPEQEKNLRFVRRVIFATRDIKPGDIFSASNIATLRPGYRDITEALHPREYETILGKRATCDIPERALIKKGYAK
ncbi:N-acetylneuraminate synthase family protein [Candidatus Woesearchaeota archaeon]|nr:N-acetylneuraminate synthase family protein [Candidatus Woesearchaeota archaeon]